MFLDNPIPFSRAFHYFPIKGMLLDDIVIAQGPLVMVHSAQRFPISARVNRAVDMSGGQVEWRFEQLVDPLLQ